MKNLIYIIGLFSMSFSMQAQLGVVAPEGFYKIEERSRWVIGEVLDSLHEIELSELRLDYSVNSVAMKRFTAIEEANLWVDFETTPPLIKNSSNYSVYCTKIEGIRKDGSAMITVFLVGFEQQFLTVRIRTVSGDAEKHESIELDIEKQIMGSELEKMKRKGVRELKGSNGGSQIAD